MNRAIALLLLACPSAGAAWQWELGGSLKGIASFQRLRQTGVFSASNLPSLEQRFRLQGSLVRSWLRAEAAHEQSLLLQRPLPAAFPIPSLSPASAWEANSRVTGDSTTSWTQRLDRAFVQLSYSTAELRVGKQVIDTGVGRLFTAVSQVQRYPFVFIDQEYPKTEDAVALAWKGPLTLEARYLPKVRGQRKDGFHLRAKGNQGGYDVAITAGRSDDKPYVGIEAAGNLGDSLLRAEIVGYEWGSASAVQALVGIDRVFSPSWSGQAEVFFNGFGTAGGYTFGPFTHRSAPYRGRWYAGASATWTISPRWKASFGGMANLHDPSGLAYLHTECSLRESLDLVVGQYLGLGGVSSELGGRLAVPGLPGVAVGLPDTSFVELRYYF